MSKSAFQKSFVNPLLRKLDKERRREVEGQRGQFLILQDIKAFIAVIRETYPDIKITKRQAQKALDIGRERAKRLQEGYRRRNKRRFNVIAAKIPEVYGKNVYKLGKDAFVVNSFRGSINIVKRAILNSLQDQGAITKDQKDVVKSRIHKGHGVIGGAVSEVQIAGSISSFTPEQYALLTSNLDAYFEKAEVPKVRREQLQQIITRYEMVVTKNSKLRADYFSTVVFQEGSENVGKDAQAEKELKGLWRSFIQELPLLEIEGSSSARQKMEKHILDKLTSNLKGSDITVKSSDPKVKSAKSRSKGKVSTTRKKETIRVNSKSAGTVKKGKRIRRSQFNLATFLGILNQQLPSVVAKNMGDPALNYRTGRFASGVRVTDITPTRQGFPSIGYTYQLYPYQTFEPGYAQGDPERDPRKLIDRSIREIMAQYAIGRFYTRRQ